MMVGFHPRTNQPKPVSCCQKSTSTVLLSLDHIRPNPLRYRCIRYIEIGGPVSMGQRTTEILIQFWIFAASPLKRPWIYLVGPTVDERNPPSSWKQRSHFKGHWWAKSLQHWNLNTKIMQRLERKIPGNILHHYLPLLNQGFLFHHLSANQGPQLLKVPEARRKSMTPSPLQEIRPLYNGLLTTMIP